MPDEKIWEGWRAARNILSQLAFAGSSNVVDLGCVYGTLTIVAARPMSCIVLAPDMEPEMIRATAGKGEAAGRDWREAVRTNQEP